MAAPAVDPPPPHRLPATDLDWRTIAGFLASVAALVVVTGFVRSVPATLASLAVATLIALALDPVVTVVERRVRVRRGVAVALVLGVGFAAFALLVSLLVPPAVRQARNLGDDLPRVVRDLGSLPVVGDRLVEAEVPEKIERSIRELPERLAGDTTPLERLGRSAVDGLVAAFITLLLALTMLLDGGRLLGMVRRLFRPEDREQADRLARLAKQVVGRYVAGSISVAALAGTVNLIAGLSLGVPLAVLAALNVVLWNMVPQVGGLFGGLPFVLLGLTKGAATGIACLVIFLVYQNIENHLIQPLLIGTAVKLSPPATMCAALVGVAAGGVVGALLVIPFVGAVKAVYTELRRPPVASGRT